MAAPGFSHGLQRAARSLARPSPLCSRLNPHLHRTALPLRPAASFSACAVRRQDLQALGSHDMIVAAPAFDFDSPKLRSADLYKYRVVPESPSYFSAMPRYTDHLLALEAMLRKYETLPTVEPGNAPRVAWLRLPEFKAMVGENKVKSARYHRILAILHRLNHIHPGLMPDEVTEMMQKYKRHIQPSEQLRRPQEVNEFGVSKGVGRRKTSSAVAFLVEGEGEVLVNNKSLAQWFGRVHDRESAMWALKATGRLDKYNVWARVAGGGTTGQAEALTLAVANALLVHEPGLKPVLRRAGCVTRDRRIVERKKHGHVKARKMPAWVKR